MPVSKEIWKATSQPGYEVSSWGRIRCWRPRTYNAKPPKEPRLVKPWKTTGGYLSVYLGRPHIGYIHREVMFAFVGPPPEGHEVDHIDHDRTNNHLTNLRWVTKKENGKRKLTGKGVAHYAAKFDEEDIRLIRLLEGGYTQKCIGELFGISQSYVSEICRRKVWAHVK